MKRLRKVILVVGAVVVGMVVAGFFLCSSHFHSSGNVALIKIEGGIYDPEEILEQIEDVSEDEGIRGVVIRIDSPGGSVGASQEIFESLKKLSGEKKIVASMGSVAASGGYYVALPAHKILANEGTITGSIGVKMEHLNIEELMKWARLQPETLKSGRWKDIGSPTRPMTDEEREFLNSLLAEMHGQFKKAVAERRHLSPEKVEGLAEGEVFTGAKAVTLGLVDQIGGLEAAIQLAGELAGIKGKPEVSYPGEKYKSLLDRLIEGSTKTVLSVVWKNFSVPVYRLF